MAPNADTSERTAIIATAREMSARGLSPGRSGNVSSRQGQGMLITPSGMKYEDLKPADIVTVVADGKVPPGNRIPSSEWRFHLAVYRARPDVDAIIHAHSLNATVLACAHRPVPAFHYMVAVAGGRDIPLVPYATFGTEALSNHVAAGLARRNACLMANHGQIAVGASPAHALELASEVETLCEMYIGVLHLGPAHVLPDAEMDLVLEKFRSYGQKAQA
jgi:L-fuculose-phosphate aldolase